MTDATDATLVRLTHQGELAAYDELHRRYQGLIHHTARRLTRCQADADDAAADAVFAVLRAIRNGYGPTSSSVGGYFMMAVRRSATVTSINRDWALNAASIDSASADDLTVEAADHWIEQLSPDVRAALNALPARWSQVLVQYEVAGLPLGEIAGRYGLSKNGLSALLCRARTGLRHQLANTWTDGVEHLPVGLPA